MRREAEKLAQRYLEACSEPAAPSALHLASMNGCSPHDFSMAWIEPSGKAHVLKEDVSHDDFGSDWIDSHPSPSVEALVDLYGTPTEVLMHLGWFRVNNLQMVDWLRQPSSAQWLAWVGVITPCLQAALKRGQDLEGIKIKMAEGKPLGTVMDLIQRYGGKQAVNAVYKVQTPAQVHHFAATVPIYSGFPYLSRTLYRGVDLQCDHNQDLIEDLKAGNRVAAQTIAKVLAKHPRLRGFDGVVIPAPRSTAERPSLTALAQALVHNGVGTRVAIPVVRSAPTESSRMRRRQGLPGNTQEQQFDTMTVQPDHGIAPEEAVLIVDDVITTGATIKAIAQRLRAAGHTGPISGAAAGYTVAYPEDADCPTHFVTRTADQQGCHSSENSMAWVDPHGVVYRVHSMGHEDFAEKWLSQHADALPMKHPHQHPTDALMSLGWLRVANFTTLAWEQDPTSAQWASFIKLAVPCLKFNRSTGVDLEKITLFCDIRDSFKRFPILDFIQQHGGKQALAEIYSTRQPSFHFAGARSKEAGWWAIDPQTGSMVLPDESDYVMGDGPADTLDTALDGVIAEYQQEWDRPPNMTELDAAWNFVTGPFRAEQQTRTATGIVLTPTDKEHVYHGDLANDVFVHFTPADRAEQIVSSGKLLMDPPYKKFGPDAVYAVSAKWGEFYPRVQTTHYGNVPLVGILFTTTTLPKIGFTEEVSWNHDVVLHNPKIIPYSQAVSLINASHEHIRGDSYVLYGQGTTAHQAAAVAKCDGMAERIIRNHLNRLPAKMRKDTDAVDNALDAALGEWTDTSGEVYNKALENMGLLEDDIAEGLVTRPSVRANLRTASESLARFVQATKTRSEREDEQVKERMVRRSPKKKPPRDDLRKHRIDVDKDPDMKPQGQEGDKDLSMNYKRVATLWMEAKNKRQRKKEEKKKQQGAPKPPAPPTPSSPSTPPSSGKAESEHKPGDTWKTDNGYAGKNPDGVTHAFEDEERAKAYAKGGESDAEGEGDEGVPDTPAGKATSEMLDAIVKRDFETANAASKKLLEGRDENDPLAKQLTTLQKGWNALLTEHQKMVEEAESLPQDDPRREKLNQRGKEMDAEADKLKKDFVKAVREDSKVAPKEDKSEAGAEDKVESEGEGGDESSPDEGKSEGTEPEPEPEPDAEESGPTEKPKKPRLDDSKKLKDMAQSVADAYLAGTPKDVTDQMESLMAGRGPSDPVRRVVEKYVKELAKVKGDEDERGNLTDEFKDDIAGAIGKATQATTAKAVADAMATIGKKPKDFDTLAKDLDIEDEDKAEFAQTYATKLKAFKDNPPTNDNALKMQGKVDPKASAADQAAQLAANQYVDDFILNPARIGGGFAKKGPLPKEELEEYTQNAYKDLQKLPPSAISSLMAKTHKIIESADPELEDTPEVQQARKLQAASYLAYAAGGGDIDSKDLPDSVQEIKEALPANADKLAKKLGDRAHELVKMVDGDTMDSETTKAVQEVYTTMPAAECAEFLAKSNPEMAKAYRMLEGMSGPEAAKVKAMLDDLSKFCDSMASLSAKEALTQKGGKKKVEKRKRKSDLPDDPDKVDTYVNELVQSLMTPEILQKLGENIEAQKSGKAEGSIPDPRADVFPRAAGRLKKLHQDLLDEGSDPESKSLKRLEEMVSVLNQAHEAKAYDVFENLRRQQPQTGTRSESGGTGGKGPKTVSDADYRTKSDLAEHKAGEVWKTEGGLYGVLSSDGKQYSYFDSEQGAQNWLKGSTGQEPAEKDSGGKHKF